MTFLVDANVLSEPSKPRPSASALAWLQAHEADLAVNPIILGELEYGVLSLQDGRRRDALFEWLSNTTAYLQILEIDEETAHVWATILTDLRRLGRAMPIKDSLIAATALQHQIPVVTRNVNDYQNVAVSLINPFD